MVDWSRVRYFKWQEFGCMACMRPSFIYLLDQARHEAAIPFVITSGHRPQDGGSHGRGWSADIACSASRDRYIIVRSLISVGFRRIGVYDRHIHADADPALPTRVIWLGTST